MPRNIEDDLRRSLAARAEDITPDPALFARVQARIRRGRTFRLAFAGAAGALAVAAIAIAAPAVMNRNIEFEPGPVATAPAPGETVPATEPQPVGAIGSSQMVFTDDNGVYSMAIDGESADEIIAPCLDCDYEPIDEIGAFSSGSSSVGVVTLAGCAIRSVGEDGGDPADLEASGEGCPASVELSPDGRHLAWVDQLAPDGDWWLFTTPWSSTGPGEDVTSFDLDLRELFGAETVRIDDWAWPSHSGDTAEGYLTFQVTGPDGIQLWRRDIERQGDGELALPSSSVDATTESGPYMPVGGMPDYTGVAFDSGSDGLTEYTVEVLVRDGEVAAGHVGRDGEYLDLPDDLLQALRPDQVAGLWLTVANDDLVLGDGRGNAWTARWVVSDTTAFVPLEATIRHAVLLHDVDFPQVEPTHVVESKVDVFFGMTGADACVADQPVPRLVAGQGVARGALTELLKGPSSRESNEGIETPFNANTAGALRDIAIVDGQARVDFADFSGAVGTDSCTKSAILDSLEKTLKQFPTVTRTRYSFDGSTKAWQAWLGSDTEHPAPPAAVTETADEIRRAAEARRWPALRRLSSEGPLSCTLSDQPEDCVKVWKQQEADGGDPLGTLLRIMDGAPVRNPDAPIWVWPPEWFAGTGYSGPRTGIDEDGIWRFYVQEGG